MICSRTNFEQTWYRCHRANRIQPVSVVRDALIVLAPHLFKCLWRNSIHLMQGYQDYSLKKNDNLRQTRDLLLPKLISGELDVSELDINPRGQRMTPKGGSSIRARTHRTACHRTAQEARMGHINALTKPTALRAPLAVTTNPK